MDQATDKITQDQVKVPGHGMLLFKVYNSKVKDNTILNVKVQSDELVLVFDDGNEEDIIGHHKVKRGTKEFAKVLMDKTKVKLIDGKLGLEFDWTGIPRIRQERLERERKLAEAKKKAEEDKIAKEKAAAEAKKAEEKRKADEEKQKALDAKKAAEKAKLEEERRKKEEEERIKREAAEKKAAFEASIMGALTGAPPPRPKKSDVDDAGEKDYDDDDDQVKRLMKEDMERLKLSSITKTWSDEHQAFFFTNEDTNDISWRDPTIKSVWEKIWDAEDKSFSYKNNQTGEVLYKEPWITRFEKLFSQEYQLWYYKHRETEEVQWEEPYY